MAEVFVPIEPRPTFDDALFVQDFGQPQTVAHPAFFMVEQRLKSEPVAYTSTLFGMPLGLLL